MLQINDKIRIVKLDKYNTQIEEYRKVVDPRTQNERYEWCWVGYYGGFRSAMSGVLKIYADRLTENEIYDCKQVLEKLDEIRDELMGAIKEQL